MQNHKITFIFQFFILSKFFAWYFAWQNAGRKMKVIISSLVKRLPIAFVKDWQNWPAFVVSPVIVCPSPPPTSISPTHYTGLHRFKKSTGEVYPRWIYISIVFACCLAKTFCYSSKIFTTPEPKQAHGFSPDLQHRLSTRGSTLP